MPEENKPSTARNPGGFDQTGCRPVFALSSKGSAPRAPEAEAVEYLRFKEEDANATTLGVDLLLELPGVQADAEVVQVLRRLDQAMAAGDTCIDCTKIPVADQEGFRQRLLATGLVGRSEDGLPMVLDDGLLSSRRYWCYERSLARQLLARSQDDSYVAKITNDQQVTTDLQALFPHQPRALVDGVDWQRLAACVAVTAGLAVITGEPGTGKTTVAGKAIAIAARRQARAGRELEVVIAAPTGKAAQRLRESLVATGASLLRDGFLQAEQLTRLTDRVATLHRLLGDRQLPSADLVVIDEVSMADAATLARVLERIPASAQVWLLGDPQQLASVEAGHVLGEIARYDDRRVPAVIANWYQACSRGRSRVDAVEYLPPLSACQVRLLKNWRSAASPAVSALAMAVQESDMAVCMVLADPAHAPAAGRMAQVTGEPQPVWFERRDCRRAGAVADELCAGALTWAHEVVRAADPMQALQVHARRRLLCARRRGRLGAEWLNARLEEYLQRQGLIHPQLDGHYHGRPLLVTRNDYDLQLYNGDIGVVWREGDRIQAYFPDSAGGLRSLPLHRLDDTSPVFAMTIHKSQGSQFDHVEVLTATDDSGEVGNLLTRELIYTAITRAAYSVRIWADDALLFRALSRRTIRQTGLGRFLQDSKH
jgi:exodeoxyribonuclease V alpha subunit